MVFDVPDKKIMLYIHTVRMSITIELYRDGSGILQTSENSNETWHAEAEDGDEQDGDDARQADLDVIYHQQCDA